MMFLRLPKTTAILYYHNQGRTCNSFKNPIHNAIDTFISLDSNPIFINKKENAPQCRNFKIFLTILIIT